MRNRLKEIRMREYLLEPQEFAKLIGINYKTYYSYNWNTYIFKIFYNSCGIFCSTFKYNK